MKALNILKEEIIEAGRRLYQRGLVAANDGNLSCRLPDGSFFITASGVSKGFLQPEDLLLVDAAGHPLFAGAQRPSIETGMHLAVYAACPKAAAIIHAHPPFATAFALAGLDMNENAPDEVRLQLGRVPTFAYGEAGSPELARHVAEGITGHCCGLLARHGAITLGDSVGQALFRMEALEHAARIMVYARQLR